MYDRSPDVVANTPEDKQVNLHPRGYLLRLKEHWQLLCLVFVSLASHLVLGIVVYSRSYIFDEVYYIPQALSIVHERGSQVLVADPSFLDHPSLAKLFIAAGIAALGDNPWGWRILSVVFGVASIIIFYFICQKLAGKRTAVAASFLLTFENFTLVYCSVAILDVFSVTFMLSSFLFFLDKRYVLSGTALALAGLCKLPGLFGLFVILGYWALAGKRADIRKIGLLAVSSVAVFLLLMVVFDFAATSQWLNPIDRIHDMLTNAASIKYSQLSPEVRSQNSVTQPWEWILSQGYMEKVGGKTRTSMFTPMLFILVVPSMLYMAYELFRKARKVAIFCLLWFGATYVVWIPIAIVTDRAMYQFYFLPAVGAVCLAVGFGVQRVWQLSNRTNERQLRRLLKWLVVSFLILYVSSYVAISTILTPIEQ